jgi:hypothetical protein
MMLAGWNLENGQGAHLKGLRGAQPVAFVDHDTALLTITRPIGGKDLWLGTYDLSNRKRAGHAALGRKRSTPHRHRLLREQQLVRLGQLQGDGDDLARRGWPIGHERSKGQPTKCRPSASPPMDDAWRYSPRTMG